MWKETKLPVGVGFGVTPTLSKAANHAAKKLSGFDGVAVINSHISGNKILTRMNVDEVWGVGSKIAKRLKEKGVNNAAQLAQQIPKQIRKQFSVVTERTVKELNGVTCLSWDDIKSPKQAIFSTRSFGQRITSKNTLRAALVTHAATVARKVRQQSSRINKLMIFAANSPHDANYYKQALIYSFIIPTDNTCELANAVNKVIDSIFCEGVGFYRCGVGAIELSDTSFIQGDLFMSEHTNAELMQCLDSINHRYGNSTLKVAAQEHHQLWQMRRNFLSPQYTSHWRDIPKIKC